MPQSAIPEVQRRGIVVQIFLCLAVMNPTRKHSFRLAGFSAAGYIAYEFAQPYLPKGVFDWKDVLGTLIGLCLSLLVLLVLWRVFPEQPDSPDSPGQAIWPAG